MHRNAAAQQSQAVHRWCCILKEKVTACLLGLAQCQPWAIQLTLAEVVPVVPTTKTHMVETNACFLRGISKKAKKYLHGFPTGKNESPSKGLLFQETFIWCMLRNGYTWIYAADIQAYFLPAFQREVNRSVQRRCGAAPISSGHGKTSQQLSHLMMVLGSS